MVFVNPIKANDKTFYMYQNPNLVDYKNYIWILDSFRNVRLRLRWGLPDLYVHLVFKVEHACLYGLCIVFTYVYMIHGTMTKGAATRIQQKQKATTLTDNNNNNRNNKINMQENNY